MRMVGSMLVVLLLAGPYLYSLRHAAFRSALIFLAIGCGLLALGPLHGYLAPLVHAGGLAGLSMRPWLALAWAATSLVLLALYAAAAFITLCYGLLLVCYLSHRLGWRPRQWPPPARSPCHPHYY